jgi:hypothetical protein
MTTDRAVDGPTGDDVRRAARWCADTLTAHPGDWDAAIPDLKWTVRQAMAHATQCCLWYAVDLSAGAADLETWELTVKVEAGPAALIATMGTFSLITSLAIDAAPSTQRGFHPFGTADPSGFAAMTCDELLIHTDDALRGLGASATPPPDLCDATVRRIFPWAPTDVDPWDALRWANGRIDLPGLPRDRRWRWHCAPLSEWDGTNPNAPPN